MRSAACYAAILCIGLTNTTLGGLGTTTGKERGLWTDGRYSVIVATMHDIHPPDKKAYGPHAARLAPLATLAGGFDCSLHPALPVRFYVGQGTSVRRSTPLPKDGATVMAVIQMPKPREGEPEDPNPEGFIVSDICTFMPGKSSFVAIDSLADPRVTETLKKIQEARANADADPQ